MLRKFAILQERFVQQYGSSEEIVGGLGLGYDRKCPQRGRRYRHRHPAASVACRSASGVERVADRLERDRKSVV